MAPHRTAPQVILFSAVGFLSPARRGSVITWFLLLFVFMGISAGCVLCVCMHACVRACVGRRLGWCKR